MSDNIILITNENFEQEVLNADKPVICDFYATWCGPCKMMSPIFDELADEMSDKYKFCKIDIDASQLPALEYKVMSVPTIMVFKDGENVDKNVGLISKDDFVEFINKW